METSRQVRAVGAGWLLVGIVQTVLLLLLVVAAARPPAVLPADADPARFSAERARATLQRLLGGEAPHTPHPVGSPANAAVRERLIAELEDLGLESQVQRRMVCSPEGACAEVENVVARLSVGPDVGPDVDPQGPPGARSAQPARSGVLLVAHYDSVPAGPGVGDDLSGVACLLEVSRALVAAGVQSRGPLFLLFSDGEELGLLGARAFVDHHPWMDEVGVVLNLEARGTSGGSILFETGADNAWLVELYARTAPRPNATSYSVELYRHMPNDTDFTPFREAGRAGLNFAFIEGVHDYHTANDSLARLDPRSLQHHGENLLPLVRALCTADLTHMPAGDLVYSDLLSRAVLSWRARWCVPLLLLELALFALCVIRARGTAALGAPDSGVGASLRGLVLPVLRVFGAWLVIAAAGAVLGVLLGFGEGPVGVLHPAPVWGAYAAATLLLLVAAGGRSRSPLRTLLGLATTWLLAAAVTTFLAPGASHLFTLPLLALLVGLCFTRASSGDGPSCAGLALATCALTTLLWSPFLHGLSQAFGLGAGAPLLATLAASAAWLPALAAAVGPSARRAHAAGLGLILVGALGAALLLPRIGGQVTGSLTLHHLVDHDHGEAHLLAQAGRSGLPRTLRAEFGEPAPDMLGGQFGRYAAPAEMLELAPPELELVEEEALGDGRRMVVILRSPASAEMTWLAFEGLVQARIRTGAGISATDEELPTVGVSPMVIARVPPEGLELELTWRSDVPLAGALLDQHLGASARADEVRGACGPAWVPRRSGDTVLVLRRISL